MSNNKVLIGYATYLNTRVSKCHYSDDINELYELVTNEMNNIPKMANCSFIIEPNLRVDEPEGYDSYHVDPETPFNWAVMHKPTAVWDRYQLLSQNQLLDEIMKQEDGDLANYVIFQHVK